MAQTLDMTGQAMVAFMRESLTALRAALFRDIGPTAATYLQESGYAGGATLYDSFARWLAQRGLGAPEGLDLQSFGERSVEYFRELGWGSIALTALGDAVVAIDSSDWAEADPAHPLEFPGCHVTTGMFADFFGRLAGSQFAVMEVECRSAGAARCRFLLGNGEIMQQVYEAMAAGSTYEEAALSV